MDMYQRDRILRVGTVIGEEWGDGGVRNRSVRNGRVHETLGSHGKQDTAPTPETIRGRLYSLEHS